MRLVTSCPACDTQFHVKPEQLAAHAGEVRCGHCQHAFNASSRLYEILEPQTLAPLPASPTEEINPDQFVIETETQAGAVPDEAVAAATQTEADAEPALSPELQIIAAEEVESPDDLLTTVEIDQGESVDTETETPSPAETKETPEADAHIAHHEIEPPQPSIEPAAATSFLAPEKPVRNRRISAWLAVPLCLLLLLVSLAQSVYFFRTELAGHWPASRPVLVSACEWLGCTVPLARNAELLALDDSDLQEDFEHPEVIQLSTKLINNASYTQAYPLLELTLTDDDEQPKLRRIFTPEEYLPSDTDIEAGLPANEEIQINLAFSTSGEVVSGYRVFVTY
ncbi:zinc-ribbon domain-containing protein [Methylobacillus arboreus]|uniref:DUF3426 domain-containing protein n=1 Tax=Methylobacillus arboreus TaxID=755170 RepID=UPI001E3EDE16|nr:DUF3426 domain-containing protein [Methylobacillus arboreus]MCB5191011.1 zinc-ribbon domain-containing protein [Methylobacillus arboreus]